MNTKYDNYKKFHAIKKKKKSEIIIENCLEYGSSIIIITKSIKARVVTVIRCLEINFTTIAIWCSLDKKNNLINEEKIKF